MHRLQYLADIILIAVAYFALEAGTNALPLPDDFRIGIVVSTAAKCLFLVLIWLWLRFRGDSLATIGLAKPRSWIGSILVGAGVAAALLLAVYLLERAGFRRNLSAFAPFKGNLELTLYQLGGVIIGAGFGEEYFFRGFLFQRLAMLFGGSKPGWTVACLVQAAVFGLMHGYQGERGVILTGSIGLVEGIVFLATGRNLWVTITAHALYDTGRIIAFYLYGLPPW